MASTLPEDANRGPSVLGVSWGTLAPAILTVTLRIIARIHSHAFGFDDACIIVSTLISFTGAIFNTLEVNAGFGRYGKYLTNEDFKNLTHWAYASEMQVGLGLLITKISICWFVLRLLGPTNRWMRWVIWLDIAAMVITTLAYIFTQAVVCIPLKAYWDHSVQGKCLSLRTIGHMSLAANIADCITDFVCAALPIALVHKLQMTRRAKIVFGTVVGLGFLTAATSIAKVVTVELYATDPSWNLVVPTYCNIIEENVSIIIASLPGNLQFARSCRTYLNTRKSQSKGQSGSSGQSIGRDGIFAGPHANSHKWSAIVSNPRRYTRGDSVPESIGHMGIMRDVEVEVEITTMAPSQWTTEESEKGDSSLFSSHRHTEDDRLV